MAKKEEYERQVVAEATNNIGGSTGTYYLGTGTNPSNYSWKTFAVGIMILALLFFIFFGMIFLEFV